MIKININSCEYYNNKRYYCISCYHNFFSLVKLTFQIDIESWSQGPRILFRIASASAKSEHNRSLAKALFLPNNA